MGHKLYYQYLQGLIFHLVCALFLEFLREACPKLF